MKYYGGCDVGSTYTKAVILDETGKICVKELIRVFYVMLTKGVDYDPKKMVSDIKRPAVYQQAA